MPGLIRLSGPYGYVLSLLALVVLFVTIRATRTLLRGTGPSAIVIREQMNAVLFWGTVSGVMGFLGQCDGSYRALSAILRAREISADVVAEGFVISFVPTLFGLGILGFSVAAWGCLRLLTRAPAKLPPAFPPLFLLLLLGVFGCSAGTPGERPGDLTEGVWVMEAGPDQFLWEFSRDGETLGCVVHDMVGSRKMNETPCLDAVAEGSRVTASMDTGVRLEGEVNLARGLLTGRLLYPDGSDMEVDLPWHRREAHPGFFPLGDAEASSSYSYSAPEERSDGWKVASAAEVGIDPEALVEMVEGVARGEAGVLHSLLVARHGRLVMEEYFHGFGPETLHRIASCTKSVSSLLIGLAIQRGDIPGPDAPVAEFFPEYRSAMGSGWEDLTLEHLLTMSMALDWSPEEAENLHATGQEFFRRALSHSVSGTPGRDWAYVSANVNLVAGILHRATGVHAEAFAEEFLFHPLGIESWNWDYGKTEGFNLMDGSLQLLPRDMAKIGQMVLDGGRWGGTQIVSEDWIRISTQRHLQAGEGSEGYGYLWWLMDAPVSEGDSVPVVFANGWGSQFIAVFPTLDLVMVTTGGNDYNGKHLAVAQLLGRYLLPAVSQLRP